MNKIFLLVASVMFFLVGTSHAHEQKAALTRIVFNERSGNVEVMHRLSLHDAEHAVKALWGSINLENDAEATQKFSNYVRSRFILTRENGQVIDLLPVGQEIDGSYLWVYHETQITDQFSSFTAENRILQEFWVDQSNLVNVEYKNSRQSYIFDAQTPKHRIVLDF